MVSFLCVPYLFFLLLRCATRMFALSLPERL